MDDANEDAASVVCTAKGGEIGEYGKVFTLNKDTDMPVDKYLHKLPASTYKEATTNGKMAAFSIVKDEPPSRMAAPSIRKSRTA